MSRVRLAAAGAAVLVAAGGLVAVGVSFADDDDPGPCPAPTAIPSESLGSAEAFNTAITVTCDDGTPLRCKPGTPQRDELVCEPAR